MTTAALSNRELIEMPTPKSRVWAPIEDLPENWVELVPPQVPALVKAWNERSAELQSKDVYKEFLVRLRREFAIETGAIEEQYKLSLGATKTLIEHGLDAALITHDDTDRDPSLVIDQIRDQYAAVEGLYQFVASQRRLSSSYIRELHQVLTEHQTTYRARDSLGNPATPRLRHGAWKTQPNNVEGSDGFLFEFCPPEQVDSEMDQLVTMHSAHLELYAGGGEVADRLPLIESAWLHHRFALVHPFEDGNGRVARCLATLILIKFNWLPLVVTRADKPAYIAALRRADDGELGALVGFFGDLQRRTILKALSLGDETLKHAGKLHGVLAGIKAAFERKLEEKSELMRRAFALADSLQFTTQQRLREIADELVPTLHEVNTDYGTWASGAARGEEGVHYNQYQIVQCAKQQGYYANMRAYKSWAALTLKTDVRTELLFAFHVIGHALSGVFGCASMIYSKRTGDDGVPIFGEIHPLIEEPFEFTYVEEANSVRQRFSVWLEEQLVAGLGIWKRDVI